MGAREDEHTAHGFRSSFSTILNERQHNAEVIELCLAHQDRNRVRAAYNRAVRWSERAEMMKVWANLLDEFRAL